MVGGPLDLDRLNDARLVASRPWVQRVTKGLPVALRSGHVYAVGANSAIWRSVFLDVDQPAHDLPFEASAAEDMDLMFRLRRAGGTVGFAPGALMGYRLRSDGAALRRQVRSYGVGDAAVVKRYRDLGARGDPLPEAVRKWARLVPAAAKAALEHDELHWARTELAGARGRLRGSVKFLVFCL
jgi:GT2 family glycosyltransferase